MVEIPPPTGADRVLEQQLRDVNEALLISALRQHELTEQAEENEAHANGLFAAAPMAIFVCDTNAILQQYNSHAVALWGRSPVCGIDRYCGSTKLWLPNGMPLPFSRSPIVEVLRLGIAIHNVELCIERTDGTRLPVLMNFAPLKNTVGAVTGAIAAFTDLTERKQMESAMRDSEARYRGLFESANDGILILDAATQKITHVNPFLINLLQYSAGFFLDKELWEIGFLRDKQDSRLAMQRLHDEGTIRYENLPLVDRHGNLHPVEMVANVHQQVSGWIIQCNIRDISERNRLEMMLRGQASELSELHRRKDEFLAMLSHELRSPLAPISNAVKILGMESSHETQIQLQARNVIERQLGQLQRLVDDLLDVSRITSGKVQLHQTQVPVSGIVTAAIETIQPLMEQHGHHLTISVPLEPILLYADAARLEQVLINLLTNAAKFTEEGGGISVTVQRAGNECLLRVRDNGVGIAPALLPRIFDLFTQSDRTLDRSQGGLGIGLALVQRLTELHGGEVNVHSVLGEGTEFVVRLPAINSDTSAPTIPVKAAPESPTRSLRILVVDDNTDTAMTFSLLLRALGHDVRTAHDGRAGLTVALEYLPDVALLDIGLPGLNGLEVAHCVRQEPALRNVTLIALTGYGQDTDRQASKSAGFDHHLVKPADFAKLQEILASILSSRD